MKKLLVFLLFFSFSYAITYDYKANSGPLDLSTKITITSNISIFPTVTSHGNNVTINLSLQNYYIGPDFSAELIASQNADYNNNPTMDEITINFINESDFINVSWYHSNCGYTQPHIGPEKIACTNIPGSSTCQPSNKCTNDLLTNKFSGKKKSTYYEIHGPNIVTKYGNAEVGALCYGTWYINGDDTKITINPTLTTYEMVIAPNAQSPYNIVVEARYKCIIIVGGIFNFIHWRDYLYYNSTTFTDSKNLNIIICDTPGINIIGVNPAPISLVNNNATINIIVRNNGTIPLNITGFSANNNFKFIPSDTLPVLIDTNTLKSFNGTLSYTGTDNPSDVTITVYANTSQVLCPLISSEMNASINVKIQTGGDLYALIEPVHNPMNRKQNSTANITVLNRDSESNTPTSRMNVLIKRCNDKNGYDCPSKISNENYTISSFDKRKNRTITTNEYSCYDGYDTYNYIKIDATVNVENLQIENDFSNNKVTEIILCANESCNISGRDVIQIPGIYNFTTTCYDSANNPNTCSDMLTNKFDWDFIPAPIPLTLLDYTSLLFGSAHENSSITVNNIFKNGILNIKVNGTVKNSNREIKCNRSINVLMNACILQI